MPTDSTNVYDRILCVGDSLTQHGWDVTKHGWTAQLSQAYLRRLDVVNRGFSGFNTRWALSVLPKTIIESQDSRLRLVTIFYGANDAQFAGYKCHVPLDEFKSNLKQLASLFRDQTSQLYVPDDRILLITPPPVGDKLFKKDCDEDDEPIDRCRQTTEPYAIAVRQVASELNLPVVDLWAAMESKVQQLQASSPEELEYDGYEEFLWDGLHLNANGNDLLFSLVTNTINSHFPELVPESMPFVIPGFRDFESQSELLQMLEAKRQT
ncbi:isoamyl acetate-hydrolyzing esterase [Coemansia brasiliensis]|uniref:Isoamyl acetate-hydrolyzing esterase n=1 Tax=Coemansia brasiliensis TaxID=2650707 RepID=A0A9W8LZY1_9FUNG|nr:isoamyl acetate-hydrolyzing esterase [Coemansia brasiliensis]